MDIYGKSLSFGEIIKAIVGAVALLVLFFAVPAHAGAPGSLVPTSGLNLPRYSFASNQLDDGRIVVIGGGPSKPNQVAPAEIWSPSTGRFALTGDMIGPRQVEDSALLQDGRIYVPGNTAELPEIFDPSTGTFTRTATPLVARDHPNVAMLPDGRVLIAGGWAGKTPLASAELFDPSSGVYSPVATSLSQARWRMEDVTLPDGRVLFLGGINGEERKETDIFDPATGSFSPAQPLLYKRADATAALLDNGKVLVAGHDYFNRISYEVYEPDKGLFSAVPGKALYGITQFPTVTQMPSDSEALVLSVDAEIVDTESMTVREVVNMPELFLHAAFPLRDGRIFFFGGSFESAQDYENNWSRGLIYDPEYKPVPPIAGKRFNLRVLGRVNEKKCPGDKSFVQFGPATTFEPGCLISGTAAEISASKGAGKKGAQKAQVDGNVFKVTQNSKGGQVNFVLWGGRFCSNPRDPVSRELEVSAIGDFKITGNRAAVFFRKGTVVLQERCDGTNRVIVKSGTAEVLDYARKRRYTLKKGRVYSTGKR